MADSDTPPTNSPPLLSPLPALAQLSGEQERDDVTSVGANPPDASALTGNPGEMPSSSEPSSSELTSSDKLTALPSHLRSSPAARSARGARANNSSSGSTDIQDSPLTPEARFAQTSAARTAAVAAVAAPISQSLSDSAAERGTSPRGRISYDSDRGSSTSPRPGDRPLPTASEPVLPSTRAGTLSSFAARTHETVHERLRHEYPYKLRPSRAARGRTNSAGSFTRTPSRAGSPQRSPSPSRAVLPFRSFLGRFSPGRAHHREDPFIPINPFQLHPPLSLNPFSRCFGTRPQLPDVEEAAPGSQSELSGSCACVPLFGSARFHNAHLIAFDTVPRQLYLHSQLRLPSLYFSRVTRIFEDAAVSRPEIQRITDAYELVGTTDAQNASTRIVLPFPEEWVPPNVSPALARFKRSWESFVDSLVREWKTLNILSALLLSAILTLFQISEAATDPLIRTAALCSLVSALMSLSYGIMYIVRFGTMRSMYRASRWAEEAQKTETAIFWNVWVLLALPGVWLAWSVLAFIVAIMSFVWRTGASGESHPALMRGAAFGPRIGITCELLLGLVYFALVIRTFRNYGETGRKERVVRRLTDVQIELESRGEWTREGEGERDDARVRPRESEEGTRDRGRSRPVASDGLGQKEKLPGNGLGLSGMDRKQETVTSGNGDVPGSDSFSSLGI